MKQYELNNLPTYLKESLPSAESTSSYLTQNVYCERKSEIKTEIKTEIVEIDNDRSSEWPSITYDNQQPSSSKSLSKKHITSNYGKKSKELTEISPDSNDEDVIFFKSLLPDISRMSSHQKLKFKQETLSIIEDILYASDEVNISS